MSDFKNAIKSNATRTSEDMKRDAQEMLRCLPWVDDYLKEHTFDINKVEELADGSFQFEMEDNFTYSPNNKQHTVTIRRIENGYMVKTKRFGQDVFQTYDCNGIETSREFEKYGTKYTFKRDPQYIEKVEITICVDGVQVSTLYADISDTSKCAELYPGPEDIEAWRKNPNGQTASSKSEPDIATLDGAADQIKYSWIVFSLKTNPWYIRRPSLIKEACENSRKSEACLAWVKDKMLDRGI